MGFPRQRILEWVAISFSRGYSWPRDQTWVSCITGGFFTAKPPGKVVSPKINNNNKVVKVSLYRLHADNNLWIIYLIIEFFWINYLKIICWVKLLHSFHFFWTSLVVQQLRSHLPMQGTWVRSLSRKISHTSEQLSPWTTSEAMLRTREATEMRKPSNSNEDPAQPKINFFPLFLNVATRKFTLKRCALPHISTGQWRHCAAVEHGGMRKLGKPPALRLQSSRTP